MLEEIKELLGMKDIPDHEYRKKTTKMSWDHTFLLEAWAWSKRSHDAQTQNGCVIVRNKRILSTGYNGFVRGIDDTALPNLRPHKYPFMMHAEQNAICNAAQNGISLDGATAYLTSEPCITCLQLLWQAGIVRIIYSNFVTNTMVDEQMDNNKKAVLLLINNEANLLSSLGLFTTRLDVKFIDKNNVLPSSETENGV